MTSPEIAAPLLTDDDVVERVRLLVGSAVSRNLWLLLVDGDDRQTPVMMPVEDHPVRPDGALLDGLVHVVGGVSGDLATASGPGSVVFVLERPGPDDADPDDLAWVESLATVCRRAGVRLRAVVGSGRSDVRRWG